jgi:hypothetical protein
MGSRPRSSSAGLPSASRIGDVAAGLSIDRPLYVAQRRPPPAARSTDNQIALLS